MSWICPHCGTENLKEPLNSRHRIKCATCNEPMTTAEEIEADRREQLKRLDTELRRAKWGLSPIVDQLSGYRQEVIDLEMELKEKKQEIAEIECSIRVLKNKPIFYEPAAKDIRARLDIHQAKLPFEGVPTCA